MRQAECLRMARLHSRRFFALRPWRRLATSERDEQAGRAAAPYLKWMISGFWAPRTPGAVMKPKPTFSVLVIEYRADLPVRT
jgi:hypothetical protein